jgi:hypothetical protein
LFINLFIYSFSNSDFLHPFESFFNRIATHLDDDGLPLNPFQPHCIFHGVDVAVVWGNENVVVINNSNNVRDNSITNEVKVNNMMENNNTVNVTGFKYDGLETFDVSNFLNEILKTEKNNKVPHKDGKSLQELYRRFIQTKTFKGYFSSRWKIYSLEIRMIHICGILLLSNYRIKKLAQQWNEAGRIDVYMFLDNLLYEEQKMEEEKQKKKIDFKKMNEEEKKKENRIEVKKMNLRKKVALFNDEENEDIEEDEEEMDEILENFDLTNNPILFISRFSKKFLEINFEMRCKIYKSHMDVILSFLPLDTHELLQLKRKSF